MRCVGVGSGDGWVTIADTPLHNIANHEHPSGTLTRPDGQVFDPQRLPRVQFRHVPAQEDPLGDARVVLAGLAHVHCGDRGCV